MSEPLAVLNSITKRFGKAPPALRDISGSVNARQITGVVGPDGAGKTTLIRLMTGLLLPDEGSIAVLGFDTRTQSERVHASIGYMPQRFGLYEDLTVLENLRLYAEMRALPPEERPRVMEELLEFTDLARFAHRFAGKLSGGMKQKLGLACALLRKPDLLLLDEPSVGVDPISRRELWRMVTGLKDQGVAVVWSTSYLDETEACDHVFLLNEGQLLFNGVPGDLTARVKGRVFRLTGIAARRRRSVLVDVLGLDKVIDGVIQGEAIRLVIAPDSQAPPSPPPAAGIAAQVSPAAPRFEDAFIDILGGGPGGHSRLAETMPRHEGAEGAVIEARGLTKRFGDFTAAADITFSIPRGEIFGLLGPNGAGKSTTFRMLCGLLEPTEGEGRVAGFDLRRDRAEAREHLGYMAQKFSLYGDLSVGQNLEFFSGAYGLSGLRKRRQIELLAEIFDLRPRLSSPAKLLPLGFKQRLALACAVIHGPEALFLDEPTSGVDPITRREFWAHIHGLVEKGVTVLVTTHFMDEAEYCDRIAVVYRGRSIALGSPDELKRRVATAERPDPTMEDAFIGLVEASDARRAEVQ
jgi:ABC-2 type transport system ATP-binding protein